MAELERRLAALGRDMATKVGQSANRAGAMVVRRAVEREAPVGPMAEGTQQKRKRKSGATRESEHRKISNHVRVKKVKAAEGAVENAVFVEGGAYHAAMVEFGSLHNAPNPFMKRALESSQDEAIAAQAKTIERRLNRAGV